MPAHSRQALAQMTGSAGAVAKTSAVIAVSGGLVASLGMQANAAAPQVSPGASTSTSALAAVMTSSAASDVPAVLLSGPVAQQQFGEIGFTATVTVKKEAARSTRVSRNTTRAELRSANTTSNGSSSRSSEDPPAPVQAGDPGSAEFGATVLAIAARYAGIPYVYGGSTPSGFDCSGFTSYVMRQVGIDLPRTSSSQRAATRRISRSEAVPGDLVFFPGHVGIYAGNGMMWDSPHTGLSVTKRAVYSSSATFGRVG